MSKHTPGPWKWTGQAVTVPSGQRLLVNGVSLPLGNHADSEEADANARLIAAAPDLLEALKGVVAVADRKTDEFDRARAAIANATGGQP